MQPIRIEPNFESWQQAARQALRDKVPPGEIVWLDVSEGDSLNLFGVAAKGSDRALASGEPSTIRVPRAFLETARIIARHSDSRKWVALYRTLWRLVHGEPRLLENPADADALELRQLEAAVARDAYRMRQFVRFRETHLEGNPWYVAWYEPEHNSVDLNAEFFSDRFANMHWSILTPRQCMHWDGEEIFLSPGVAKSVAPLKDDVESLWIGYYSSIFNPARLKVRAMKAQMPVRNWKNLPEAAVIAPLLATASHRMDTMISQSESRRIRDDEYRLADPPRADSWSVLRDAAATCRACPLWKNATCTVFGEGETDAAVLFVGEQPGDQEDRTGKPFVGPAGRIFDRALSQAGIERAGVYVTNAVKHFKWEPRGKRRIHQTPNARDIAACRPWLEAEIKLVRPKLIVALGRTATQSLFNTPLRITEERGHILDSAFGKTLVTVHPSALLRLPAGADVDAAFDRFVADLRKVPENVGPG